METDIIGIIAREDAIEGVIMKFLQIHFREKIAEYVVYYYRQYGFEVEEPDLGVFGENIWDNVDIDCNGRHISIKSTKERGQLLLLEKGDWNDQGCYIPNINDGGKMAQWRLSYAGQSTTLM